MKGKKRDISGLMHVVWWAAILVCVIIVIFSVIFASCSDFEPDEDAGATQARAAEYINPEARVSLRDFY